MWGRASQCLAFISKNMTNVWIIKRQLGERRYGRRWQVPAPAEGEGTGGAGLAAGVGVDEEDCCRRCWAFTGGSATLPASACACSSKPDADQVCG